jgi:hypothetical protein
MTHLDKDVIKRETFPAMVDAYGYSGTMNIHDLWNILDQFQTQIMDKDENDPLVFIIGHWMQQLEDIDIQCAGY